VSPLNGALRPSVCWYCAFKQLLTHSLTLQAITDNCSLQFLIQSLGINFFRHKMWPKSCHKTSDNHKMFCKSGCILQRQLLLYCQGHRTGDMQDVCHLLSVIF